MGAANRVEGRGGFVFERYASAVVEAFGEFVGGDQSEDPGREEGAKKGGRNVGVFGLESVSAIWNEEGGGRGVRAMILPVSPRKYILSRQQTPATGSSRSLFICALLANSLYLGHGL